MTQQLLGVILVFGLLFLSGGAQHALANETEPVEPPTEEPAAPAEEAAPEEPVEEETGEQPEDDASSGDETEAAAQEESDEPEADATGDVPGESGDDGNEGNDGEDSYEEELGEDGEAGVDATPEGEAGDDTLNEEEAETYTPEGEGTEGAEGENGNNLGAPDSTNDSIVVTGDSDVAGDILNASNNNNTNTEVTFDPLASSTPEDVYDIATSSTPIEGGTTTSTSVDLQEYEMGHADIDQTISANNNATTSNVGAFTGSTGGNSAGSSASAVVDSGDSVVTASVVNVVNSNIVNSDGMMEFLNFVYGEDAIDVRDQFDIVFMEDRDDREERDERDIERGPCDLVTCANSTMNVASDNNAAIDNDLILRSDTGENAAYAGDGVAYVSSGDAFAAANVVNVANTNIVDSNYLLLTVNNFGDLNNDIILPGMGFFMDLMGPGTSALVGSQIVDSGNYNTLGLENNLITDASSGDNLASTSATATGNMAIATGDAHSSTNVLNKVNQNIFGGTSLTMLIQVHGEWNGDIFGLPEGIVWKEVPGGIELSADPNYTSPTAIAGAGGAYAGAGGTSAVALANRNNAQIRNNIEVYALTGDNKAESTGGSAIVETGDAYAAANVTNLANTNVVGANWITAVFNIFGDWNGNLSFGAADLWVGGRAQALAGSFHPGAALRYTFTVTNFGDTRATDVFLKTLFDERQIDFSEDDARFESEQGWYLGDLNPGESVDITIDGTIDEEVGYGKVPVDVEAVVTSNEGEVNTANNSESLTIISRNGDPEGGSRTFRHADSNLVIEKNLISPETVVASSTATYEIIIENKGGPAYYTALNDVIYDPNGKAIHAQTWELGTIYQDEEIYISYEVFFNASTTPGVYKNVAGINGIENHDSLAKAHGKEFQTEGVSAEIEIIAADDVAQVSEVYDQVMAEAEQEDATLAQCTQYISEYLKYGEENSLAEVARLQLFLNKFEDAGLVVSGEFDLPTFQAVHAFQRKYETDILGPWGIGVTTGYVYYTTQQKINQMQCNYQEDFPLTPSQMVEIREFKAKLEDYDAVRDTDLDFSEVGFDDNDLPDDESFATEESDGTTALLQSDDVKISDGIRAAAPKSEVPSTGAEVTLETTEPAPVKTSFADKLRNSLVSVMKWMSYNFEKAKQVAINE